MTSRCNRDDGSVALWVVIIGAVLLTAGGLVYDSADKANDARRATMTANEAGRAAAQELSADVIGGTTYDIDTAGAADAARAYLSAADVDGSVTVDGTRVVITTSIHWEPKVLPLPTDTINGTATIETREVAK